MVTERVACGGKGKWRFSLGPFLIGAHVVMMRGKTRGRLRSLAVQLTSSMFHALLWEIGPTGKTKRLQTFLRKSHNIVHALI